MGRVEQTVDGRVETVLCVSTVIAQYAGLQSRHRVEQGHGGQLPPGQDKVAQTELLVHFAVDESLVHTLITTAYQDGAFAAGPALDGRMTQDLTDGRKQYHWCRYYTACPDRRQAGV